MAAVKLVLNEPSEEVTNLPSGPVNFIVAPLTPELERVFSSKPDTVTICPLTTGGGAIFSVKTRYINSMMRPM